MVLGGSEARDGAEGIRRRKKSPYAQRSSDDGDEEDDLPSSTPYADYSDHDPAEEDDEDDNLPLGIAIRRGLSQRTTPSLDPSSFTTITAGTTTTTTIPRLTPNEILPPPKIRLRRGSEGYEIRPVAPTAQPRQSDDTLGNVEGENGRREDWAPEGFYDSASDSSNDAHDPTPFDPSTRYWSSDIPRLDRKQGRGRGLGAGVGEENEGMEIDSEGDMVRRGDFGGRYRRYEREVDSEEESEDSMEKYLKDE